MIQSVNSDILTPYPDYENMSIYIMVSLLFPLIFSDINKIIYFKKKKLQQIGVMYVKNKFDVK